MKRMIIAFGMVGLVCFGSGCSTSGFKKVDVNKGLNDYYNQPRTVDLVTVHGTNMTVTITGLSEFKVASILPPLNAIPREPGITEKIIDGTMGLAKWGLGWYYGSQILTTALQQPRTVDPVIVEPEVVLVE